MWREKWKIKVQCENNLQIPTIRHRKWLKNWCRLGKIKLVLPGSHEGKQVLEWIASYWYQDFIWYFHQHLGFSTQLFSNPLRRVLRLKILIFHKWNLLVFMQKRYLNKESMIDKNRKFAKQRGTFQILRAWILYIWILSRATNHLKISWNSGEPLAPTEAGRPWYVLSMLTSAHFKVEQVAWDYWWGQLSLTLTQTPPCMHSPNCLESLRKDKWVMQTTWMHE